MFAQLADIVPGMAWRDAAAIYASLGWPVGIARFGGKEPLTRHGLKDATIDGKILDEWHKDFPQANLLVPSGPAAGWVTDVDPRNGGLDSLVALEAEFGKLQAPLTTLTGGSGIHFRFPWPEFSVKKSAGLLAPGIDVLGSGSYTIMPPSVHASGFSYEFVVVDGRLATPAWLLDRVQGLSGPRNIPVHEESVSRENEVSATEWTAYVAAAVRAEVNRVASAREGCRNDTLNVAAFALGQLVGAGVLDWGMANAELTQAALEVGLPAGEARSTIVSGLRAGGDRPRDLPSPQAISSHVHLYYTLDDMGNSDRFTRDHQHDLRWVETWRTWLVYGQGRWARDDTRQVVERAKATVETIPADVDLADTDDEREAIHKWAGSSRSKGHLVSLMELAKSSPPMTARASDFDQDPWLLNVLNGTVDLHTGSLQEHRASDLLMKRAGTHFDADAIAPTWELFLRRVVPDQPTREYLARIVGYLLTGDVRAQCLFFLYGGGANGKSTFLETLRSLLGDYGQQAPQESLLRKTTGTGIPNDIARMAGARLLAVSETEEGRHLDETVVKSLTGGDSITARFLYGEFFEFTSQAKILVATNHLPVVRNNDEAIWRRIKPVPFLVTIPAGERDGTLGDQLRAELPGILNWALTGLADWQSDFDLREPSTVTQAVSDYRAQCDLLGQWIEAHLEQCPGARTAARALFQDYQAWATGSGLKAMSEVAFAQKLTERGYTKSKATGSRRSEYHDLVLLAP